jgi:hypothetical protein
MLNENVFQWFGLLVSAVNFFMLIIRGFCKVLCRWTYVNWLG